MVFHDLVKIENTLLEQFDLHDIILTIGSENWDPEVTLKNRTPPSPSFVTFAVTAKSLYYKFNILCY